MGNLDGGIMNKIDKAIAVSFGISSNAAIT